MMAKIYLILLWSCCFMVDHSLAAIGACSNPSSCSAVCNGKKYDIEDILKKESPILGEGGKYSFAFTCLGTKCGAHNSSAICQTQVKTNPTSFSCGDTRNVEWAVSADNPLRISVLYSQGQDQRTSELDILLNTSSTTTLKYVKEDQKKYFFQLTVKSESELFSHSSGVSPGVIGWVLIFLALIAFVTYFIVGAIIMYFWSGARGVEIIPNYLFWKTFPLLLKDGFMFTLTPFFMCCKRGEYSRI